MPELKDILFHNDNVQDPSFLAWFKTLPLCFEIGDEVVSQNFLRPIPETLVGRQDDKLVLRNFGGRTHESFFNCGKTRKFEDTFHEFLRREAQGAIQDILDDDALLENFTIEVWIAAR